MRLGSLAGRRVVVTGGASGIGRCLVEAFLAQGCTVEAIDIDPAAIESLASAHPGAALTLRRADLADTQARQAVMQSVVDAGPIDVLVTNAADDTRHAWAEVTPESWQRTLAINLDHHFFSAQVAARSMTALITVPSMPMLSASTRSMLHSSEMRPRKMLPPPTTIATSTPSSRTCWIA
jgi:NAD(P)-dependent dehydrogenase (short-subunit alcohol dehydrogenase family)